MKASQALEVGSTPIARSRENTAPSERWCFLYAIYVFPLSYLFQFLPILRPFIGRDTNHRECLIGRHPRHKDESTEDSEALFPLPFSSPFFSLLCKTDRVAHITRLLFCGRFDRMNLPINLLHKVICRHRTVDVTEKRLDGCVDFARLCPHAPHPTRAPRSGTPASR